MARTRGGGPAWRAAAGDRCLPTLAPTPKKATDMGIRKARRRRSRGSGRRRGVRVVSEDAPALMSGHMQARRGRGSTAAAPPAARCAAPPTQPSPASRGAGVHRPRRAQGETPASGAARPGGAQVENSASSPAYATGTQVKMPDSGMARTASAQAEISNSVLASTTGAEVGISPPSTGCSTGAHSEMYADGPPRATGAQVEMSVTVAARATGADVEVSAAAAARSACANGEKSVSCGASAMTNTNGDSRDVAGRFTRTDVARMGSTRNGGGEPGSNARHLPWISQSYSLDVLSQSGVPGARDSTQEMGPGAGACKRTRRGRVSSERRGLVNAGGWRVTGIVPTEAPTHEDGPVSGARTGAVDGGQFGTEPLEGSPFSPAGPLREELPCTAYDADGRWFVESLTLGDGSEDANGLVNTKGVLHASAQATATMKAFHPVNTDADLFLGPEFGDEEIRLPTYSINAHRDETPMCVIPPRRFTRQPRSMNIAGFVTDFLKRHPGVAVITGMVGARAEVNWPFFMRRNQPGQPHATAKTYSCLSAAVVNAVFALRGHEAAARMKEELDLAGLRCRNLRPLGRLFQRTVGSIVSCRVEYDSEIQRAIQCGQRRAPFEALVAKRSGVFIVRLRQDSFVDHAVVVDAFNRIVVDSEEEGFALQLSTDVLERCGGPCATALRVTEVREVNALSG